MRTPQKTPWQSSDPSDMITCDWQSISAQILSQWHDITQAELDSTGHDRMRVALLIYEKYGVQPAVTENYLKNLERTLPLFN